MPEIQRHNSTPTEPLTMLLDLDPTRGDRPRDVRRVVLRVVVETTQTVEGHKLSPVTVDGVSHPTEHFIEVYADRVKAVQALVRGAEHEQLVAVAKRQAQNEIEQWIGERMSDTRGMTQAAITQLRQTLERKCPIHWAQKLASLGGKSYKGGLPPLLACEVVREYGAPITPENATKTAHSELAQAIAQAIEASRAPSNNGNSNRK